MKRITMSPEIFSGYTNPYPKNMKKVLWTENINGQEHKVSPHNTDGGRHRGCRRTAA